MESESSPEKYQRRKLKKIRQKLRKPKVNLNSSASVVYYKKVKAALNASLNSSRANQTLRANNKALAQSLQQVKQELRLTLNENGRLMVENQDLTIRLRRLENLVGGCEEKTSYEQRLFSLKAMLNNMSRHLLDLGTCVSDAMDFCLTSPRTSDMAVSYCSAPGKSRSPELKKKAEDEADPANTSSQHHKPDNLSVEVDAEMCLSSSIRDNRAKTLTVPDMSIILEQSVIDVEEKVQPLETKMNTVEEECFNETKDMSRKTTIVSKLPQRVRNVIISKNSTKCDVEVDSQEIDLKETALKTKSPVQRTLESNISLEKSFTEETSPDSRSSLCTRRKTFLVSKNIEGICTGSVEDITSISMPNLVSGSPLKAGMSEITEMNKAISAQNVSEEKMLNQSSNSERKCKMAVIKPKDSAGLSGKEKEKIKSEVKKTMKETATKQLSSNTVSFQKDPDFFISNPCALNLVHQRVTGSSDGCVNSHSDGKSKFNVELFIAEIKEANMKSNKVASLISEDDSNSVQTTNKRVESIQASDLTIEADKSNKTLFFDTDMEFTEILSQTHDMECIPEQQICVDKTQKTKETEFRIKGGPKIDDEKQDVRKQSHIESIPKSITAKEEEAAASMRGITSEKERSGDDKKLAVALRVGKPGQMVFAVSRKEEDGSRKEIPFKLPNKTRSKSKKQVEDILRNLPQKESASVFDFHDKTPKHVSDKKSIFDLSVSDSAASSTADSLAVYGDEGGVASEVKSTNEELTGESEPAQEATTKNKLRCHDQLAHPCLLGDAPVYELPLKDDSSSVHPRSRGRSVSRGREPRKRSRSKSHKEDKEDAVADVYPKNQKQKGRSRSQSRSDPITSDNDLGESRKQKCRNKRASSGQKHEEHKEEHDSEAPRRSARSKSRITYIDGEDSFNDSALEKDEKTNGGRSRNRIHNKDDDETYKPPVAKAQRNVRSKRKKQDSSEECKVRDADEPKVENPQKKVQRRSRTRSVGSGAEVESVMCNDDMGDSENDILSQEHLSLSKKLRVARDDATTTEFDSGTKPIRMITERRRRSKSCQKRLHDALDCPSDASQAVSLPHFGKDVEVSTQSGNGTNSLVTLEQSFKDGADNFPFKMVSLSSQENETALDKEDSPSKVQYLDQQKSQDGSQNSMQSSESVIEDCSFSSISGKSETNILETKNEKSNLPIPVIVPGREENIVQAQGRKGVRTQNSLTSGKNQYQMQIEELKRKLKALDPPLTSSDSDLCAKRVKKSRPLVLQEMPHSSEASTKLTLSSDDRLKKSQTFVKSKKENSEPVSPRANEEMKSCAENPVFHSQLISVKPLLLTADQQEKDEEKKQEDGRRIRRVAASVSYREPPLNSKLRRGDPYTTFLHKEETLHIFKSPKGSRKHDKPDRVKRVVLHDLTNMTVSDADVK